MENNYIIELKNVSKIFDDDTVAVDNFNLYVRKGEFITFLGPSGCGKSTTLRMIAGFDFPSKGEILLNGKDISDRELIKLIEELEPLINEYNRVNKIDVTLFELETIMSLLYFHRNKVDFVVLETGLGGLYDCTNIITKPLVSIISSISYDHVNILGNSLEEIAIQKAGIIKISEI